MTRQKLLWLFSSMFLLTACGQVAGGRQTTMPYPATTYVPISNFAGVNAYEWDFSTPANAHILDSNKLQAIRGFSGVRHYLDWERLEYTEGSYTFNPAFNGGWNYDTIYTWCRSQGIEVVACIKTIPKWLETTYPDGKRNSENVPARYGSDLLDPASYIQQARMAFQFAARYGNNTMIDTSLLKVNNKPRWTGDDINTKKAGMGVIHYIECDNERDKWWKGRQARQTGAEYAANLSAFFDGDKGKLGNNVGVKTADTSIKVVMAGLANPDTAYLREMIEWSRVHRGYKADGSIDLPWDVINYHYYCNDANGTDKDPSVGVPPESSPAASVAAAFVKMAHDHARDMPLWVTETGYDLHPKSPQRAGEGDAQALMQTQADWLLRTALLYSRCGIQKMFTYQLYDDNALSPIRYGTSGLINANGTDRPAACYLKQVNRYLGKYQYRETLSQEPIVDRYVSGNKNLYVLVSPQGKGTCTLDLGKAATAYIYTPQPTGEAMQVTRKNTTGGKLTVELGSTPVFVSREQL